MEYKLGRVASTFDERDYNIQDFMPKGLRKLSPITSRSWKFTSAPLNQKETNHCVGFSIANFCINDPVYYPYKDEDGHKFYYIAKEFDGDPKGESGSTIRSAAKTLKKIGRINAYAFASDMAQIKWWLLNKGPMIAGTIWTSEMFSPGPSGKLSISGDIVGGHAYLINEWTSDNFIGIQNSWGYDWGKDGKAYIHYSYFEKLFRNGGEVIAAVELERKQETKNWFERMFYNKS